MVNAMSFDRTRQPSENKRKETSVSREKLDYKLAINIYTKQWDTNDTEIKMGFVNAIVRG